MDIASSIQAVTEEVVLRLARTVHSELGAEYLCLAGGVALNCVANGRLLREGPFKDIWIQPAAGDAGGAVGAAAAIWHEYLDNPRRVNGADRMQGAYLGPRFSEQGIQAYLDSIGAHYIRLEDNELMPRVAEILAQEHVVGWFQGRLEFGPRALGGRSILGDARSPKMQSLMNLKIKYRESFRPFAPAVLAERASDYFELDRASPYMLLVAPVREDLRVSMTPDQQRLFGIEKLNVPRSSIPAVTHVDHSARIQTVHKETNANADYPTWPWWLAGALTAWALAAPDTLQGVYRVWMKLGMILNRITSPVLMGLVFYLVITPVGCCMRVFKRDPMARSFDKNASSYRVASRKSLRHKMERPF